MEEYRFDPIDLTFSLVSNEKEDCKECLYKKDEIKTIEFRNGYLKIYEIKDRLQPSKYELTGDFFKKSNAHGYEEIIVENDKHSSNFRSYSADDIEKLLLIISQRIEEIKGYDVGENVSISRYINGHDYWDVVLMPIPRHTIDKCFVCQDIKNVGNREVFKTENIIAYIPFSPNRNEIVNITTNKHVSIEQLDSVIAFDIANLIIKIIKRIKNELTINIIQSGTNHFYISIFAGNIDPIEAIGVKRIKYSPEETAKKLSEELNNGI